MIAAKILVDTSVLVYIFYGEEQAVQIVEKHRPVFVPVVVLAELLAGAYPGCGESPVRMNAQQRGHEC